MDKLTRTKVAVTPPGFKESNFTINGVTLNYVVGPDNGLPLLLIPGQMESWQGYKCVLPELSSRCSCSSCPIESLAEIMEYPQ